MPWAMEAFSSDLASDKFLIKSLTVPRLPRNSAFGRYLRYLNDLKISVRGAIDEGKTADAAIASLPLGAAYLPPQDAPQAALIPFLQGLHSLNVQRTYRDLTAR